MEQANKHCKDCQYFHQHYIREDGFEKITFKQTEAGHCGFPRLKLKRPQAAACEHYQEHQNQQEGAMA